MRDRIHRFENLLVRFGATTGLIVAFVISLLGSAHSAYASGWVVNTLTDATNGTCSSTCTLRDAMTLAASGDTITFNVSGMISLGSNLPAVSNTLTIDGSGQTVTIDGSGLYHGLVVNNSGNLSVNALTINNGNDQPRSFPFSGSGYGGGIDNNGTLNVTNSTFSNNSVYGNSGNGNGGAIYNSGSGRLNVANSTFYNNGASASGFNAMGRGGGIDNNGGTANITNSTFYSNSASASSGGGIYNGGTLKLNNTILTNNTNGDCSLSSGTTTSANDLSDGSCGVSANAVTNISSTLASNGGYTQTFALLSGSNAIDAVPNGSCVYVSSGTNSLFTNGTSITTDQRGAGRPQGALCDIGAYEFNGIIPTATNTATSTPSSSPTPSTTASYTQTATPTNTPTSTPSNTATSTPTNTGTAINTLAPSLVVNTLTDVANGNCLSTCTLRDAMTLTASGGTITFSVSGTIVLGSTLPAVSTTLTIDGTGQTVAISGNSTVQIMTVVSGGYLSLDNLTVSNGLAFSRLNGGAINNSGILNVSNSTVYGNTAIGGALGGAIYNTGTLNVLNSTFTGNTANNGGSGGALNNAGGGAANIANSTFSGNSVTAGSRGGAIYSIGTLNVSSTTFSGNSADFNTNGSAIYNINTMVLNNSILTNSTHGDCFQNGTVTGANDFSDGSCGLTANAVTNLSSTLASNGGSTQTFALLSGSNAIDAVPNGSCVYVSSGTNPLFTNGAPITTDQRGISRPRGTLCDIGAYEAVPPAISATPSNTSTATSTSTPISTNTVTSTNTPSKTATFTPTNTATATNTPTNTSILAKIDTIGIFRAGTFYLRLHNSTGNADLTVAFTAGTKPYPIVGDWTGSGFDTVGVFDQNNGQFTLCTANVTASCANAANQKSLVLGIPNDQPLSGRWLLSATNAGVGVFRPSNGLIYLKTALTTGYADYTMVLGIPGDVGLAGDWNGKGFDSPGVYRPSNSTFYLSNKVTNGSVFGDYQFAYGLGGDAPVTGDWIGQGHDGVGLFRQSNGFTYLKNALTTGYADNSFTYGIAGDVPVAGHWQAVYPPIAPPTFVLIAKTAVPVVPNGSIGSNDPIGD